MLESIKPQSSTSLQTYDKQQLVGGGGSDGRESIVNHESIKEFMVDMTEKIRAGNLSIISDSRISVITEGNTTDRV